MRRTFELLALTVFGIALALLVAELTSRLTYTTPWYEKLVEVQIEHQHRSDSVPLNRFGLRDKDYAAPKPPDTKRVLLLGDSFTFGFGVPNEDAVFARVLERDLNAGASGARIEIMNGGITASMTKDWVELLDKVKEPFQPDVILIVFFLRDGTLTTTMGSYFRPIRRQIVAQNGSSAWYRRSYMYRVYKDRLDRTTISQDYTKAINEAYTGGPEQTSEWRAAQNNFRSIKATAASIHARVGLVVFPVLAELDARYPFLPATDAIVAFTAREQIPTMSLLPAFEGKEASAMWVSPFDQHPNATAHRIAAEGILPFLRGLLSAAE